MACKTNNILQITVICAESMGMHRWGDIHRCCKEAASLCLRRHFASALGGYPRRIWPISAYTKLVSISSGPSSISYSQGLLFTFALRSCSVSSAYCPMRAWHTFSRFAPVCWRVDSHRLSGRIYCCSPFTYFLISSSGSPEYRYFKPYSCHFASLTACIWMRSFIRHPTYHSFLFLLR